MTGAFWRDLFRDSGWTESTWPHSIAMIGAVGSHTETE